MMNKNSERLSRAENRTLALKRLLLRPLTIEDLEDYHELTSDDAALKYDYPAHQNIEESEAMLIKWHLSIPFGRYGVYHRQDDKIIGNVSIRLADDETAYLGYTFNQNYWHQGYATEATSALINLVFTKTSISKILAEVDKENIASVALLKRLGFERINSQENVKNARGNLIVEETYLLPKTKNSQKSIGDDRINL